MADSRRDPYQGFSLQSVCWGYRELFETTLEGLFDDGYLGEERPEITREVFQTLHGADQSCFDHVLKEFLVSLNPSTRWLLDIPAIFTDVITLGRDLGAKRVAHGMAYFRAFGQGGFGETPAQVQHFMRCMRRLLADEPELAFAFLTQYRRLAQRLRPIEIDRFIDEGLALHQQNHRGAMRFLDGSSSGAEDALRRLTQEANLQDEADRLKALIRALTGRPFEVAALDALTTEALAQTAPALVCLYKWLYLPARVRSHATTAANSRTYRLMAVVSAGAILEKTFSSIHGCTGYDSLRAFIPNDPPRLALLHLMEWTRLLACIRDRWPGARDLLAGELAFAAREWPQTPAVALLDELLNSRDPLSPDAALIREHTHGLVNIFDASVEVEGQWADELLMRWPHLTMDALPRLPFLPDWLTPTQIDAHDDPEALIVDLKAEVQAKRKGEAAAPSVKAGARTETTPETDPEHDDLTQQTVEACYLYDEWDQNENRYRLQHCRLYEEKAETNESLLVPGDVDGIAQRVRRTFERLKPDLITREKYLEDGDVINTDLLVRYLTARRREPAPRIDFYERPVTRRRDLAVLVLLDTSGSTSDETGRQKVIDVEKRAALIFGQGLAALDDTFSVCGFNTHGRENCHFTIYKDFEESWDDGAARRLWSAAPRNATRLGVALRHAGWRLSRRPERQRLAILVTDGRPMDTDYDPYSRYAQHDVRMACEENERQNVQTLGISTEENSLADMEIMFPRRRFAILPDIRDLPRILPRLYLRLTT